MLLVKEPLMMVTYLCGNGVETPSIVSAEKWERSLIMEQLNNVIEQNIRNHVHVIADEIGERNVYAYPANLNKAAKYIGQVFLQLGYCVEHQKYFVSGTWVFNLEVSITGKERPEEVVIVGAHYDSAVGSPGANDNGSGVAALLELARLAKQSVPNRTIRFVAFVNEESPYFQTERMGSHVYAKACHNRGVHVVAMISLETIGYYSDEPASQHFPHGLNAEYSDVGNFISFVSNEASGSLVERCSKWFKKAVTFPIERVVLADEMPGIGRSDHWSFWQFDYPAFMVTDTAPYRYPHYHEAEDTLDKIDIDRTATVVIGLHAVITGLSE